MAEYQLVYADPGPNRNAPIISSEFDRLMRVNADLAMRTLTSKRVSGSATWMAIRLRGGMTLLCTNEYATMFDGGNVLYLAKRGASPSVLVYERTPDDDSRFVYRSDFVKKQDVENAIREYCVNDQGLLSKVDYTSMRNEDLGTMFRLFAQQSEVTNTRIAAHAEEVKTHLATHADEVKTHFAAYTDEVKTHLATHTEEVKAQLANERVKVERLEQATESHKTIIERHDKCVYGLILGFVILLLLLGVVREMTRAELNLVAIDLVGVKNKQVDLEQKQSFMDEEQQRIKYRIKQLEDGDVNRLPQIAPPPPSTLPAHAPRNEPTLLDEFMEGCFALYSYAVSFVHSFCVVFGYFSAVMAVILTIGFTRLARAKARRLNRIKTN